MGEEIVHLVLSGSSETSFFAIRHAKTEASIDESTAKRNTVMRLILSSNRIGENAASDWALSPVGVPALAG
jgi:hypothetical protein